MRPELWPEVESALGAALERPEAERLAWVAQFCQDPEVRAEVEVLLGVYNKAEGFLDPKGRLIGAHLGHYEILELIGAGGMGEVYRARDPRIGRNVAVKVLPAVFSSDPDRVRRFALEVRAAGSLNHPNIIVIHDLGTHAGVPYLVSELLEGETLRSRLDRGALPTPKALEYALGIARGLAAAHSKGIVHRDLKPENIFLTTHGQVKILDFGLARLTHPEQPARQDSTTVTNAIETAPGMVMGTASYMSPEQVRGEPCDHRSDIFSFGAILYEMLTGQKAFPGDSQVETMSAVLKGEPPDPPVALPLLQVLRHCLEKNPPERFQSAGDLAFAIESLSKISGALTEAKTAPRPIRSRQRLTWALAAILLLGLCTAGAYWAGVRTTLSPPPSFHQLSFRRGSILSARFAPDGRTVLFGARWEGNPLEIFMTRPESPESRSLGFANSEILSISNAGELAVSLGRHYAASIIDVGTLARVPMAGGAPREILENVQEADWAPDGASLAAIVFDKGRSRIEFPIGKVLYQGAAWLSNARVSPKGDMIAFIEHARIGDDSGSVAVVDLDGAARTVSSGWSCIGGLAWPASGKEIWFTAARTGNARALHAVSLSGSERLVARAAGALILHDISREGLPLVTRDHPRTEISALAPGELRERDLSWLDNSAIHDLSLDGKTILFDETGEGGGSNHSVYARKMDGSPAVRLGDGSALGISADAKWALSVRDDIRESGLVLLPLGAGTPKALPGGNIHYQQARWLRDGKRILILGSEPGRGLRLYMQDIDGGNPRLLTPQAITSPLLIPSPDGHSALARGHDGRAMLFPIAGGPAVEIPGLTSEEPVQWAGGADALYVYVPGALPSKVYRLNLANGRKEFWKELMPSDSAGVCCINRVAISADGKGYAYNYRRLLSNLYLVEGI